MFHINSLTRFTAHMYKALKNIKTCNNPNSMSFDNHSKRQQTSPISHKTYQTRRLVIAQILCYGGDLNAQYNKSKELGKPCVSYKQYVFNLVNNR